MSLDTLSILNRINIKLANDLAIKNLANDYYSKLSNSPVENKEIDLLEKKIVEAKIYLIKEKHLLDRYEEDATKEVFNNLQNARNKQYIKEPLFKETIKLNKLLEEIITSTETKNIDKYTKKLETIQNHNSLNDADTYKAIIKYVKTTYIDKESTKPLIKTANKKIKEIYESKKRWEIEKKKNTEQIKTTKTPQTKHNKDTNNKNKKEKRKIKQTINQETKTKIKQIINEEENYLDKSRKSQDIEQNKKLIEEYNIKRKAYETKKEQKNNKIRPKPLEINYSFIKELKSLTKIFQNQKNQKKSNIDLAIESIYKTNKTKKILIGSSIILGMALIGYTAFNLFGSNNKQSELTKYNNIGITKEQNNKNQNKNISIDEINKYRTINKDYTKSEEIKYDTNQEIKNNTNYKIRDEIKQKTKNNITNKKNYYRNEKNNYKTNKELKPHFKNKFHYKPKHHRNK